jgi:AhpD family alkylhydroperoxidase
MTFKIDLHRSSPKAMEELLSFQQFAGESGLDERFVELVRMYVSQRNQCSQAIEVHARRAQAFGESTERLSALSQWRSVALYDRNECAAFEWAECVLRTVPRVFDAEYSRAREAFSETELVDLTIIIVATNAWNRVLISFGEGCLSYPE